MSVDRRRLHWEIFLVLTISFGISGLRSILRLIDALLSPTPLNQQQVTLNAPQSHLPWLDLGLQVCSAAVLFAWGGLAIYLLRLDAHPFPRFHPSQLRSGLGLAALIGLPGLVFYWASVHFGLSKEVIPSGFDYALLQVPILLMWSAANAFAEEVVVVWWLMTRLKELRLSLPTILLLSAILRGSYHLYQGVSAGFGNIVMGIVYGYFYYRTGKIWPLIIGHFLIDAVAFVGYNAL